MNIVINPLSTLFKTENHVLINFSQPMLALSSAVLNGGLQTIRQVLNLKVSGEHSIVEQPAVTLKEYYRTLSITDPGIGMMTAASWNSLRYATCYAGRHYFTSVVTSGLHNVRCAGDKADVDCMDSSIKPGTINLVVITNARLSLMILVEAVMIATEAKASVLESLQIKSPRSGKLATGTGTDTIAVIANPNGDDIEYVGKHVLAGEQLAQSVIQSLTASIEYCRSH